VCDTWWVDQIHYLSERRGRRHYWGARHKWRHGHRALQSPLDSTIKLEQDGEETTERPVHKVSPPCLRHQVASKPGNALLPERKPLRVLPFYPQTLSPCPHRTRNHPSSIRSFILENPQPAILQHLRVLALSKFLSLLGS